MPFRCKAGDTAFMDDDGGGHRYIVLTNPNKNKSIVIVNFTSASKCPNHTVFFTSKDSKYLFSNPTRIPYRRAIIVSVKRLTKEVNRADIVSDYRLCPQDIFEKIIDGAFKSEFTVFEILEELSFHYPEKFEQYYPNGLTI